MTLRPWALLRSLRVRAAKLGRAAHATPVARAKVGSPYDDIDDEFHAAYERARLAVEHEVPVFVVLADELVFLHGGERKSWSFSPRGYQLIKMVSHGPLAIFASLQPGRQATRTDDVMGYRANMRAWLEGACARLDEQASGLAPEVVKDLRTVLMTSARFLDRPTADRSREALHDFAAELGPVLLRLIDAATELQLGALHAHVEEALGELDGEQRKRLEVVVTGNHQARVRSLPMQYFRLRLKEPATGEGRVVYAEGVDNERDALALVGTRRIDRALATAFFHDAQRMQRDLLGDAAKVQLERANLAAIV